MRFRTHTARFFLPLLSLIIFLGSCSEDQVMIDEYKQYEPELDEYSGNQGLTKAPNFQGKNLVDGGKISLNDTEGYVHIINFWATWCPPCKAEVPGFVELQNKYEDRKFIVIGFSVDTDGEKTVEEFIRQNGVNYPVVLATEKIIMEYETAIGNPISSIPTTLFVDRDGNIASVHVGFRTTDQLEQEIQKLL